nr:AMP-binding protein [Rhodococcus opacus]
MSALGAGHGDRYALVMRNETGFAEATLAGAAIGAVPVPANWHGNSDDLGHVISDSAAKVVLVHTDLLPKVEAVLPPGTTIVEVRTPERHDHLRRGQHLSGRDRIGDTRPRRSGRRRSVRHSRSGFR